MVFRSVAEFGLILCQGRNHEFVSEGTKEWVPSRRGTELGWGLGQSPRNPKIMLKILLNVKNPYCSEKKFSALQIRRETCPPCPLPFPTPLPIVVLDCLVWTYRHAKFIRHYAYQIEDPTSQDWYYWHWYGLSGVFRMCERRGPRGSGGRKSPSGVRGKGPVGGLGDEVPQKLTLFCYWMPKFWCFRGKKSVKQPKIPS